MFMSKNFRANNSEKFTSSKHAELERESYAENFTLSKPPEFIKER